LINSTHFWFATLFNSFIIHLPPLDDDGNICHSYPSCTPEVGGKLKMVQNLDALESEEDGWPHDWNSDVVYLNNAGEAALSPMVSDSIWLDSHD
jgi:hypothetical protein